LATLGEDDPVDLERVFDAMDTGVTSGDLEWLQWTDEQRDLDE